METFVWVHAETWRDVEGLKDCGTGRMGMENLGRVKDGGRRSSGVASEPDEEPEGERDWKLKWKQRRRGEEKMCGDQKGREQG